LGREAATATEDPVEKNLGLCQLCTRNRGGYIVAVCFRMKEIGEGKRGGGEGGRGKM